MTRKGKKRKLKVKALVVLLLCLGLVVAVGTFGLKCLTNKNNNITNTIPNKPKEPVVKKYSANLVMVGDALIHSSVYKDANRLAGYNGYDFKPQIELVKEQMTNYDIAYYNQETILGGTSLGLSDYPCFNSPQEVGDAMIDAGFNLVSTATNHTLDSGGTAITSSREYWNSKKGVQAVGSYTSNEEKQEIESKILEANNITYAMLNYTYGTNGITVPSGKEYYVNLWNDETNFEGYKETVKKDIESLRDKVDVLIVAMHWGREYTHTPTDMERKMAEYLASLDVDIIIGTHPHVIQPVEWIDDTLVFYSLGNFISAQYQNQGSCTYYKCMVGLMSSLTINKTVTDGKSKIEINNIENGLLYTYYTGWSKFKVIPFSNSQIKDYLPGYDSVYNNYAKIIESTDERIKTIPLAS